MHKWPLWSAPIVPATSATPKTRKVGSRVIKSFFKITIEMVFQTKVDSILSTLSNTILCSKLTQLLKKGYFDFRLLKGLEVERVYGPRIGH